MVLGAFKQYRLLTVENLINHNKKLHTMMLQKMKYCLNEKGKGIPQYVSARILLET